MGLRRNDINRAYSIQALMMTLWASFAFAQDSGLSTSPTEASSKPLQPQPVARIYKGNELQYDILSFGNELGQGGVGRVREATVRTRDGQIKTIAIKTIRKRASVEEDASVQEQLRTLDKLLAPVYEIDQGQTILQTQNGLHVVYPGTKQTREIHRAVISELANGGSLNIHHRTFKLNTYDPMLEERLKLLLKLQKQTLNGIAILSSLKLAHSDIKAANLFAITERGFNWNKPDASKIRFLLGDLDNAKPVHEPMIFETKAYLAPEVFLNTPRKGSTSNDVYSLALSLCELIFGTDQLRAFQAPYSKELERLYSDPVKYEAYINRIKRRFAVLERSNISENARNDLIELREFVLSGLSYQPENRPVPKFVMTPRFASEHSPETPIHPSQKEDSAPCEPGAPGLKKRLLQLLSKPIKSLKSG